MKPTGAILATRPIIDGWQRIKKWPVGSEGERIAPRGFVEATVPSEWKAFYQQEQA